METKQIENHRNQTLTLVKIVATILVVMVHAGNLYGYAQVGSPRLVGGCAALAAAGVPLFFVISSYFLFSKERDWVKNIKNKTKTLLIPYLFWELFYVLFEMVGHVLRPTIFENVLAWTITDWCRAIFGGFPILSSMPLYIPLWFVRNLFIINLLYALLCHIKKMPTAVIYAIAVAVWLLPIPIELLARETISFILIGIGLAKDNGLAKWLRSMKPGFIIPLCGIAFCGAAFCDLLWCGDAIYRMAVLVLVVGVYWICSKLTKREYICQWAETMIPYSFPIYVLHGKILSILQNLTVAAFPQAGGGILLGYFLLPAVVVVVCILIAAFARRFTPKLFAFSMGRH